MSDRKIIYADDAIDLLEELETKRLQGDVSLLYAPMIKGLKELPSAQPERLTDDDFETIRIHLNAYKEKLCNQRRWEEAEEYQRIIDRFMAFASAQPEPQWIPCSERLPKDEIAYYLVTLVDYSQLTYRDRDTDIARWDYDRRKGPESWHWCKEREVIAWMPLPEPYQAERKKEKEGE